MKSVVVRDDVIKYDEIGEGEPYLFLGGFFFPPEIYDLKEIPGFKIITPYLSGAPYRKSPPIGLDDNVNLLRDFCQHKGIEPKYLAGHSYGASIAIEYASLFGAEAVYAADPAIPVRHFSARHCFRYLAGSLIELTRKDEKEKTAETLQTLLGYFAGNPKASIKQVRAINKVEYTGSKSLKGIISYGLEDKLYPERDYKRYFKEKKFPSMRKKPLKKQGHNWLLHNPELVESELKSIIA